MQFLLRKKFLRQEIIAGLLMFTGAFCSTVGILIERWLFFAEATHTVTLYYGAEAV